MYKVRITQHRTITVPVPDAKTSGEAFSLIVKEYNDNGAAALGTDQDWDEVNVCINVMEDEDGL